MCGGIGFQLSKIPKKELKKFYSQKEMEKFSKTGEFQSYFWAPQPVLPIEKEGEVQLMLWGNRNDELKLPKTGWAKIESLEDGKWAYLHPEYVKIPAARGYEKGVWFEIKSGSLKGVVIEKDDQSRVYMMTKPAEEGYEKLTKHNRQPVEFDKDK